MRKGFLNDVLGGVFIVRQAKCDSQKTLVVLEPKYFDRFPGNGTKQSSYFTIIERVLYHYDFSKNPAVPGYRWPRIGNYALLETGKEPICRRLPAELSR